jgi:hypothetical protein
MFWNNKQKLVEERIADIIRGNYEYGVMVSENVEKNLSKKNILIVLEIYSYLNCLTDFFLNKNKVDQNIRRLMFDYSWGIFETSKMWSSLTLSKNEINNFIDDRIANYANILNKFEGFNKNYFEKIIEYKIQLISEIIKNNKLLFFNPLPRQPTEYSPINLDLLMTNCLNELLHNYIIDYVIPLTKVMDNNFVNDYFFDKNYRVIR